MAPTIPRCSHPRHVEDRLISKKQAMHVLTVSLSTLNRLLKNGQLPFCKIGQRRVGIPSSALQRFIHQAWPIRKQT
jgi:excisionase family DNA binding protein